MQKYLTGCYSGKIERPTHEDDENQSEYQEVEKIVHQLERISGCMVYRGRHSITFKFNDVADLKRILNSLKSYEDE